MNVLKSAFAGIVEKSINYANKSNVMILADQTKN